MTWGQFVHYYKFNISKWHLSTSHLNLEEEAVYFRLINFYYDTEQPIPLETHSVIRRLRLGSYSDIVDQVLNEFFTKTELGWVHSVCDDLIAEYHLTADKNRKNGKSGGRPKKINELDNNPDKTQSVSTSNPEITLTKNYKLKTNNYIKPPEGVSESIFKEYLDMRKKAKKGWTERIQNKLTTEGNKLGWSLEKVLEHCLEKEWIGFEAAWVKKDEEKSKELPLGTDQQIAHAYKVECGGDPTQSRFNSYYDMRKFILDQRDKRKAMQ